MLTITKNGFTLSAPTVAELENLLSMAERFAKIANGGAGAAPRSLGKWEALYRAQTGMRLRMTQKELASGKAREVVARYRLRLLSKGGK